MCICLSRVLPASLRICNVFLFFFSQEHLRFLGKFAYPHPYSNDFQRSDSVTFLVRSKIYLTLHYIPLLLLMPSLIKEYNVGLVLMAQHCNSVDVCLYHLFPSGQCDIAVTTWIFSLLEHGSNPSDFLTLKQYQVISSL